jgi:FtsP/CotA-like multicopper oxidase with cupredoxin domain
MARPSRVEGEEGADEPMLHDWEQEKRFVPGTRERGTAFCLCLSIFLFASFIALAGVLLSPFFVEPPPRPVSTPASEPPKGESTPPSPPVAVVASPSDQLDLKTGFEVSNTPKIRDYVFNITLGRGDPDGYAKSMIFVNGQSPGPLIEANTGDLIRIVVNNQLPEESTTIHWHGIDQRNSNWMDGVYGVTQCAIPPGQTFTYEFNVTGQRGTFWYHSHDSLQYSNGLYGPLIIHDQDEKVPHVDDDKVVMFGDLFHRDTEEVKICLTWFRCSANKLASSRVLQAWRRHGWRGSAP